MKNNNVIKEYDERGHIIHRKDSDGYESWCEYDENGNEIHYKNNNGYEEWREYDENGNEIHYKNNNGYEEWREYDENNHLIFRKIKVKSYNKNFILIKEWKYDNIGREIYYCKVKEYE